MNSFLPAPVFRTAWRAGLSGIGMILAGSAAAQSVLTTPVERAVAGQTVILERIAPPPQVGGFDLRVVDQRRPPDKQAADQVRFRLRAVPVDGAVTVPPERHDRRFSTHARTIRRPWRSQRMCTRRPPRTRLPPAGPRPARGAEGAERSAFFEFYCIL